MGTYKGVARFDPDAAESSKGAFTPYPIPGGESSQYITALAEGADGALWCGTHDGVYRMSGGSGFKRVELGLGESWSSRYIQALAVDGANALWAGTADAGIYRRTAAGMVEHYSPCRSITAMAVDRRGKVWAGSLQGVYSFADGRLFTSADGLPNVRVHALFARPNGEMWAGTEVGIGTLDPDARKFARLDRRNGLPDVDIRALGADADENVWAAGTSYLMRIGRVGLVTYTAGDGLQSEQVNSLFEDGSGSLVAVTGARRIVLNRFDGTKFHAVEPRLERGGRKIRYPGWATGQTALQDHVGDWWIATGEGLCRFRGIHRFEGLGWVPPAAVYRQPDGLAGDDIFRVFEDSGGDLWISTIDKPGLTRWRRELFRARDGS